MKLSSANIALAQPGQTLKDPTVPGLHLKVTALKRSYYLYYRTRAGQERRPKLGDHPTLALTQARATAKEMLAQVALGEDPSKQTQLDRKAPLMSALIERFEEEHLPRRKATTQYDYKIILKKWIKPELANIRIKDVTQRHIAKLHAKVGKTAPVQANRVIAVASKLFALAELWELRKLGTNPCQHIERFREEARRRYMTETEARSVAEALAKLRDGHRFAVDFILLLVLTGARKGEIAATRWQHYKGDRIELPRELVKTEARTIYLSEPARAVIDALPRTNGTVIQIKDPRATWQKVREMTGLHDLRIHDLRHTYASVLLAQGYTLEEIGQLLGHTQADTTKRYAHLIDKKALAASADAGKQLTKWLDYEGA